MTEYAWKDRGPATSLELGELAEVLVRAHALELGEKPALPLAELLLAQVLLETNRTRSMWRHNWGNLTAGAAWKGDIWRPSWYELEPGGALDEGYKPAGATERDVELHALMEQNKAPRAFRAYATHEAGARDYVRALYRQFRTMIDAGRTGDPVRFAEAVRSSRYCPDCTEAKGFSSQIGQLRDSVRAAKVLEPFGLATPASGSSAGKAGKTIALLGVLWWASQSAVW